METEQRVTGVQFFQNPQTILQAGFKACSTAWCYNVQREATDGGRAGTAGSRSHSERKT